jgi:hypothetical protein
MCIAIQILIRETKKAQSLDLEIFKNLRSV